MRSSKDYNYRVVFPSQKSLLIDASKLNIDLLSVCRIVKIYLKIDPNLLLEMVAACIGICIVAMLYEGLKVLREVLLKKSMKYRHVATDCDKEDFVQTPANSTT